jgi:hypothetical protein
MISEEEVSTSTLPVPTVQERPSAYAERLAAEYAASATDAHKKSFT